MSADAFPYSAATSFGSWPLVVPIQLRNADGVVVACAVVGPENAHLAKVSWSLRPDGYVTRRSGGRKGVTLRLQRVVLALVRGDVRVADHVDGDPLNNLRSNLRAVTRAENQQNRHLPWGTSRFRGVSWDKSRGRWVAKVTVAGRQRFLGYFASEEEAARVATKFRREHLPFSTS